MTFIYNASRQNGGKRLHSDIQRTSGPVHNIFILQVLRSQHKSTNHTRKWTHLFGSTHCRRNWHIG